MSSSCQNNEDVFMESQSVESFYEYDDGRQQPDQLDPFKQPSLPSHCIGIPNEPSVPNHFLLNHGLQEKSDSFHHALNKDQLTSQNESIKEQTKKQPNQRENHILITPNNHMDQENKPIQHTQTIQNPKRVTKSSKKLPSQNKDSSSQSLESKQSNSNQTFESKKKTKRIVKKKRVNSNGQKRNGINHQSPTQKIIKKVSNYHFSKNYRQQSNSYAKKICDETGEKMTLQTFKQKLQNYFPKPCKQSTFISANFQKADQRNLVQKIYQKCVRTTFVLMYESQQRRDQNDMKFNQQVIYNQNEYANPCLDDQGNKDLMSSFDKIFQDSFSEFEKECLQSRIQLQISKQSFKKKLLLKLYS